LPEAKRENGFNNEAVADKNARLKEEMASWRTGRFGHIFIFLVKIKKPKVAQPSV